MKRFFSAIKRAFITPEIVTGDFLKRNELMKKFVPKGKESK